jgi:WS/DGAT/MGAT family acyltransferase
MTDQLTALDATFLELEEADESAHMHIGALLVFAGDPPTTEQAIRHLEERLGALPRYRQKLSEPRTGGLSWPAWIDDPEYDTAAHVRRAALPAPGGERELMEWLSDYWSHRLDRGRPLWEAVIVEGLADGRWALVTKTHHCMVDGVGSIDVGHLLLDTSPTPEERPPVRVPEVADDGDEGVFAHLRHSATGVVRAGADMARHPRRTASHARALGEVIVRDELIASPRTCLNVPIGTTRSFDVVRVELDELKSIKNALGGTVNDVVLAAASGGLRRLLLARGEEPPSQGLRAMVPMNVRVAGEHLALGNKITSLFVNLPVAAETPVTRYAHAVEAAEQLKAGNAAEGGTAIIDLAGHAPPVLHTVLAQSLFASRLFNVTITNVPGPTVELYAFGNPLIEVAGLVPLAAEHCVGMAILSYDGHVTFGLIADRRTLPDLDVLKQGIEDEIADLQALAATPRPRAQMT